MQEGWRKSDMDEGLKSRRGARVSRCKVTSSTRVVGDGDPLVLESSGRLTTRKTVRRAPHSPGGRYKCQEEGGGVNYNVLVVSFAAQGAREEHKEQNRADFGTQAEKRERESERRTLLSSLALHSHSHCYRLTAGWTEGRDSCSRISDPMKYQTTSDRRQP